MTGPAFVDTNVLVYSRDAGEPAKQARAMDLLRLLWETRIGRVSQQVLHEYYVTVSFRKGSPDPIDFKESRQQ
jgi:predicted nucleic acid-binding protein